MAYPYPPHNNFLAWPYDTVQAGKKWGNALKNYKNAPGISLQNKLNRIHSYYQTIQSERPITFNFYKKAIGLMNRRKELLAAQYIANGNPPIVDKKAGCVLVFADGYALYTVVDDGGQEKFGFPKGEIEFLLPNPADIRTVTRESSMLAALRELWEETGFYVGLHPSLWPVPTPVFQPFAAPLHRLQYPETYTIRGLKEYRAGGNYYLVLFLNEPSVALGPPLVPLTSNAVQENIVRYSIRPQATYPTRNQFNDFSRIAFSEVAPGGGSRQTRKTKRRAKKTRRSRG